MLPGILFQKVLARLPRPEEGCWEWPGSRNDKGYGKITVHKVGTYYVHRIMFGWANGYVPPEIDHTCRNSLCARPPHLEDVSHAENCSRATGIPVGFCAAGHLLEAVGWWPHANGRKCKACHRQRSLQSYYRRKQTRTPA